MPDIVHDNIQSAHVQNQPVTARQWYATAALITAQTLTGTGNALDARSVFGGYGAGFYVWKTSGNSASADFLVSLDSADWFSLTSINGGVNATATGQVSGYYPYWAARVTWVSAGDPASARANLVLGMR